MEQRRLLFKSNVSLLREKNNNIKAANEIRAKQRRDLFSSTRNISTSPSPQRKQEHKENLQSTKSSPPKECEKQMRQKAYLMKYMAWKANKIREEQAKKEQTKRPAFVVPCGGSGLSNGTSNTKRSFAPKNHSFKPPDNLKDLRIDIVGQNQFCCKSGNQEGVYSFVPTPKKESNVQSRIAAMKSKTAKPISLKPLYLKPNTKPEAPKPLISAKPISIAAKPVSITAKPVSIAAKTPSATLRSVPRNTTNTKLARPKVTQLAIKSPVKSDAKIPIQNKPLSIIKPSSDALTRARTKQPPVEIATKPPLKKDGNIASKFKLPPPSQYLNKNTKKTTTSTTNSVASKTSNSKAGLPPLKRPTLKASKKFGTSISNAFAAVNGNMCKKNTGKFLLPNAKTVEMVLETPTDVNSLDTVLEFVTSTKRKSSSLKNSKVDLFAVEGDVLSPVDSFASKIPDFVRYSIVEADANANASPKKEALSKKVSVSSTEPGVTPIKDKSENTTPTTYLSPYVSVSRGKVSTKIEREKRNSVYLGAENPAVPEAAAIENHTMATVRYYQKQLTEEVNRLHEQCKVWEEYKEANPQLADVGGMDMINATIGQTKLLINKKLKQFGGLIDRCEEGLRNKSTDMMPVLPEDLDGFWSMVGLQIENVDKRFANIERWKANNWTDPDEVQIQTTNVKKTRKIKPAATARPNQALQKMLKAAHAAYLKKKAVGEIDDDVILTPSRRQVVIKDRRSRSAAATVITVNTMKLKRISSETQQVDLNETPKLVPHVSEFRKSMNLLRSALQCEQERKSPVSSIVGSSNQVSCRKSILKTPGSVRRSKNVIFNKNPIKFTIEDTLNDSKTTSEIDVEEEQRTYKLRNRRIVLRDSAEFEIPK